MISTNVFAQENILGKALQVSSLRNEVIQNNIANVDTPMFKKSVVSFEETLGNELKRSGAKNLDLNRVNPTVNVVEEGFNMRLDGNNVDIDSENVQLYVNAVRTDALANSVIANFRILNMAIMGR